MLLCGTKKLVILFLTCCSSKLVILFLTCCSSTILEKKKVVDSEDLLACSTTFSQTKLVCKLAPARVAEALLHSTSPSISMYKIVNIVQRLLRHRTRPSSEGTNARKKNQNLDQKRIFFLHTAAEKNLNL